MIDAARTNLKVATRVAPLVALTIVSFPPTASAQTATKRVLSVDDYTKWKSIGNQSISGDGKWVAYVLSATNTAPADAKPVLHLVRLDNSQDLEIPNGTAPAFSPDSKWLAYTVDASGGGRGGRGGAVGWRWRRTSGWRGPRTPVAARARRPHRARRIEKSRDGHRAVVQDIQSFTFAATSSHIVLRRRAPEHRAGPPVGAAATGAREGRWPGCAWGGAPMRRVACAARM